MGRLTAGAWTSSASSATAPAPARVQVRKAALAAWNSSFVARYRSPLARIVQQAGWGECWLVFWGVGPVVAVAEVGVRVLRRLGRPVAADGFVGAARLRGARRAEVCLV